MCSHAYLSYRYCRISWKNHKIHLFYALVCSDKALHCTNCGCVFACRSLTAPWMPLIAHSQATMLKSQGGAIYAWVGHRVHGLTVVENRIHYIDDTILQYECLELFVFLYWTLTTYHRNYNICSGIDIISTELVSKHHPPWSEDTIMALLSVPYCYGPQIFLLLLMAYTNPRLLCIEKRAITQLTKWQRHWEWKERSSSASFQLIAFVVWRHFVMSNLWVSSVLCEDGHRSVRRHIEIAESAISIWVSCLLCFQYWGCGMKQHPWNLFTPCRTERQ